MEEKTVVINQIGYLPKQKKTVIFKQGNLGEHFQVIEVKSETIVYTGQLSRKLESKPAKEEVWIGDFSELEAEGEYKIITPTGEESYTFVIGQFIYKQVFQDAVRFFYLQRCGEEISEAYGDKWAHPACHTTLARIYGSDKKIEVTGGWHDAGDYGRYIVATSKAVADLMLAYKANPEAFDEEFNVPRKDKQIPYILEEIKGQLIWMLKMQDKHSGGVYHKVTCARFPSYDTMPQDEQEELIVCPISTAATGTFTAVMAMAYEVYQKIDDQLAEQCLSAARQAWKYLMDTPESNFKNPEDIVTGEYGGKSDLEERYWAAAQLFKATGEEQYKYQAEEYAIREELIQSEQDEIKEIEQELEKNASERKLIFAYDWSATGAYGDKAYLHANGANPEVCTKIIKRMKQKGDYLLRQANQDGYGICSTDKIYLWGSNMYILMLGLFLKDVYEIDKKEAYIEQVSKYIDYCFGLNPLNLCYITGYGTVYPKHPHHRPSIAKQSTIPGMLVGGANKWLADPIAQEYLKETTAAKCYLDHEESYGTNEVDIYWNSMLVRILAELKMV